MGLDVGEKTIGIAVSDALGLTAQGLEVIRRTGSIEQDLQRLKEVVQEKEINKIVIGMPRNMNGSYGPQSEKVQKFAEIIKAELNLPLETWDERLTTVEAERLLVSADMSRAKRRKVIDKMAASLILQGYLDSRPASR
jgi:putative Holliday junction resolvase